MKLRIYSHVLFSLCCRWIVAFDTQSVATRVLQSDSSSTEFAVACLKCFTAICPASGTGCCCYTVAFACHAETEAGTSISLLGPNSAGRRMGPWRRQGWQTFKTLYGMSVFWNSFVSHSFGCEMMLHIEQYKYRNLKSWLKQRITQ